MRERLQCAVNLPPGPALQGHFDESLEFVQRQLSPINGGRARITLPAADSVIRLPQDARVLRAEERVVIGAFAVHAKAR